MNIPATTNFTRSLAARLRRHFISQVSILVVAMVAGCGSDDTGEISASGTIEADEVAVSPLVTATVMRIPVSEGDVVHKGDTLAILDDSDLQLQRNQLLAALDITRAQYEMLANGPRPEDIGQAQEAVRQARATLDNAAMDLTRARELFAAGAVPEKNVDDAKTRHEISARAHESARLAVSRLQKGSRSEELRAGLARESQASAQLLALDKKIRDCIVLAPSDGVVTTLAVNEGELAPVGGTIATLARTSPLELSVYVTEAELGRVRVGQRAVVTPEIAPDRRYEARITYISPTAEFTPKNIQTKDDRVKQVFELRLTVPNPDGILKAGMTADARLSDPNTNVAETE